MILDLIFKVLLQSLLFQDGSARCQDGRSHEVAFAWRVGDPKTQVDFNWPNETFRQIYERTRRPAPIGVKVYKDSVYISFPRWRPTGYPVNFARVARPGNACINKADSPVLE